MPKTNERLYVSLETTRAAAKLGDTVKHAFSVQEINPVGLLLLAQSDTYTSNECACAREIKEQAEQLSKGLAGAGNSAGFRDCCPRGEKERLEAAIRRKKTFLQETLSQRLRQPKQQRPDLFILSGPEQIVMLLKVFLK